MCALCGAVITAGSLIGLGPLSIGIGTRYSFASRAESGGALEYIRLRDMDSALLPGLVFLILFALIGPGMAFVGLAYHHHRRFQKHLHAYPPEGASHPRVSV
jgi:hypothetical protein